MSTCTLVQNRWQQFIVKGVTGTVVSGVVIVVSVATAIVCVVSVVAMSWSHQRQRLATLRHDGEATSSSVFIIIRFAYVFQCLH